jgi:DNA polymerase IV
VPLPQETRVIASIATGLLDAWLASQPGAALRLLGVGVSDLGPATQLDLFTAPQTVRDRGLDEAVDRIRERFGGVALTRASALERRDRG